MLNVFIGYGCNLKCGYCLQAPEHARDPAAPLMPRADKFIERVIPFVKKNGVRQIAYWGGEPLLYWKVITRLHEAFREAGVEFDLIKFTTNATLLEPEHVERLNEWGAYVIVSQHRGYGEPRWDNVAKIRRASLSYLFTAKSMFAYPWLPEIQMLEQRYGREFYPFMHWVRATEGAAPEFHFTHAHLHAHVAHLWCLAQMAAGGHRVVQSLFRGLLREWRNKLDEGSKTGYAPPMCYGSHQIDVDLEGNRYNCHHTVSEATKIGPLGGFATNEKALNQAFRFIDTAECRACPINTWCRGNCHLSQTHDVDCRLSKEKHKVLTWLNENWSDQYAGPVFQHQ